jgi:hypothetical protein
LTFAILDGIKELQPEFDQISFVNPANFKDTIQIQKNWPVHQHI